MGVNLCFRLYTAVHQTECRNCPVQIVAVPVRFPQWQFFPAAVLIPVDSGYEWHMATFFYESCVDVLIFLVLWFGVRKRKRWNGQLLAVYMLMYGIGRAVIEGLRMDSLYSGSIRISQIVSITFAAVGLIWLLIGTFARKNPQREG